MKKVLISIAVLAMAGCSSAPSHKEEIHHIAKTIEKSTMNGVAYCGKENFYRYMETDYYYNFVCKDGSNFMIKKQGK